MAETDFSEIERLSEKVRRDPKSRMFAQLADAYRKAGMFDEAFDVLKNGLENHPNYATAHLVLARCYLDKHMHEMAKDTLKKFVSLDPQSLVGFKLFAQTCERLGDDAGLITAYKGITSLDPTDNETRRRLEALLKKKSSEDVLTSISLAKEYEKQGYLEKALEIYKKLSYQQIGDVDLQRKITEISQKLVKKVDEKKVEIAPIEGLQAATSFVPTADVKPPQKLETLTPLEDLIPPEKTVEPVKPTVVTAKEEEPLPSFETILKTAKPAVEETRPEIITPIEELTGAKDIHKVPEVKEVKEAKKEPPTPEPPKVREKEEEITPLETLLATPESAEDEIPALDKFITKREEKPKPAVVEERIPSLDELITEEKPKVAEKPPIAKPIEEKPVVVEKPAEAKPPEEKPKGDDAQSFQDWLSSLLK